VKHDSDPLHEARLVVREARPDAKRRVTLGKALDGYPEGVEFAVYRNDKGQIILDPMVRVPAREAWLYANPQALTAVRRGLDEAARDDAATLGSFASFAGEE
jgi:hypothetical protein